MGDRLPLVLTAGVTAVLGVLALVTGAGWVASLAGLGAIAVGSLAMRTARVSDSLHPTGPVPDLPVDSAPAPLVPEAPIIPPAGGALDEQTLDSMLHSRIALARRTLQPLSLVHLEVSGGGPSGPTRLAITRILEETLRESDVFGRRSDGVYVFVLADTGEDGAVWTAERIRRRLDADPGDRVFAAGIACYPAHGLDPQELETKAAAALGAAREWKRDRIEVATAAL